jgi:hypothetical protein
MIPLSLSPGCHTNFKIDSIDRSTMPMGTGAAERLGSRRRPMPAFAGLSNTKQSLIERADDPTVMATNIQTQIDKMKPLRQSYRDEYGHLCEFSHPNSLGAVVYFQTFGEEADVEIYSDCGPDPENDLKWSAVVSCNISMTRSPESRPSSLD